MATKSWASHNKTVFKQIFEQHCLDIKQRLESVMHGVAREMLQYISETVYNTGDDNMPFYSGNLRDSTGLGVYIDGVLVDYAPPQVATEPQYTNKQENIWGFQELSNALSLGASKFKNGIWVVLFSTTPYAIKVDERGSKYWTSGYFSELLVKELLIPQFKTAFAQEFPTIAKQLTI
jgi:hypothetical protein